MSDQDQHSSPTCNSCGGVLKLAAGSVAKLSSPGFVDFLRCDDCGNVITAEQKGPPGTDDSSR